MNTIKLDYTSGWKYKPDYITTNTTTPNSITTCISVPAYLDDEIKRKVNQMYKEREAEMSGMSNIQFVDCCCAGKTRSGYISPVVIDPEILQKAVENTVKLIDNNTRIVE